jgi:hypothetical protein
MELSTLVLYDVEDDRARTRVAEACKDFGLERVQFSCFRGNLSRNKREELEERLSGIQRQWERWWRRQFPDATFEPVDHHGYPEAEAKGEWRPAFKIMIQPVCEKDLKSASYQYLFVDVPRAEADDIGAASAPAARRSGGEAEGTK